MLALPSAFSIWRAGRPRPRRSLPKSSRPRPAGRTDMSAALVRLVVDHKARSVRAPSCAMTLSAGFPPAPASPRRKRYHAAAGRRRRVSEGRLERAHQMMRQLADKASTVSDRRISCVSEMRFCAWSGRACQTVGRSPRCPRRSGVLSSVDLSAFVADDGNHRQPVFFALAALHRTHLDAPALSRV